jgi:hypothetical protein
LYVQGIQFVNETQNWSEWWTLWRRVAGGLSASAQTQLFDDLSKYLDPANAKQANVQKQLKIRSYDDMVRLAAVLERLSIAQKTQLGEWLLARLAKASESSQTWWAVGRIGARQPFHASNHHVIPAETVAVWLERLLLEDWKKNSAIAFAVTLIARMTGDRSRDIDDALRHRIIEKLKQSKAPASWLELVEQQKALSEKDEQHIFGEALPAGLKLIEGD